MKILDLTRGRPDSYNRRPSLVQIAGGWSLNLVRTHGAWGDPRTWLNVIRLLKQVRAT